MLRKQALSDTHVAVTFALPAGHPNAPISLVGDFNGWMPGLNPLKQRPDGALTTTILLPPGSRVHFRYLGSDGVWFDDADADGFDDQGGIIHT